MIARGTIPDIQRLRIQAMHAEIKGSRSPKVYAQWNHQLVPAPDQSPGSFRRNPQAPSKEPAD